MLSIGALAAKVFGSANDRRIKSYRPTAEAINALEPELEKLSDADLRARTEMFRKQLAEGTELQELLVPAFATVREAAKRTLGQRHFDVQLIGGMVLHQGKIAEMKTGEGKTLVATLPVYLNALTQRGVHVVTVNDYLAKRDAEWMGRIYKFLGLTVGCIVHELDDDQRREQYACDVTYATNNELGFDYLRDNMKMSASEMVQRGHAYAIVDEVDSILIDEARTPLIISGPVEDRAELYNAVDELMKGLAAEHDKIEKEIERTHDKEKAKELLKTEGLLELDEKQRQVSFTEAGNERLEQTAARARAAEGRLPLRHRERHGGAPRQSGAQGPQAVPARPRLHREGRRGHHHRRVHRPHDAWPALLGRPAPGARGQGARQDPAREPDARVHHLPELLPALREAGGHDRHGGHRGQRIPRHLQARRARGADQHAGRPHRRARRGLPHGRGEGARHRRRDRRLPAAAASRCWSAPRRSRSPSSSRRC